MSTNKQFPLDLTVEFLECFVELYCNKSIKLLKSSELRKLSFSQIHANANSSNFSDLIHENNPVYDFKTKNIKLVINNNNFKNGLQCLLKKWVLRQSTEQEDKVYTVSEMCDIFETGNEQQVERLKVTLFLETR